jgi:hypothetical protein
MQGLVYTPFLRNKFNAIQVYQSVAFLVVKLVDKLPWACKRITFLPGGTIAVRVFGNYLAFGNEH